MVEFFWDLSCGRLCHVDNLMGRNRLLLKATALYVYVGPASLEPVRNEADGDKAV